MVRSTSDPGLRTSQSVSAPEIRMFDTSAANSAEVAHTASDARRSPTRHRRRRWDRSAGCFRHDSQQVLSSWRVPRNRQCCPAARGPQPSTLAGGRLRDRALCIPPSCQLEPLLIGLVASPLKFTDDDYYQSAPDLPPGLFSVHSVQAWAADAHDEIPPPGTSISRSTSGSTLPQVVTPAAISPASSTTSPSLSFRGQAPIRRIPSGPGARRAGQVLLKGHFRGGSAASENSQFVTSGSPVEYGDAFGDGDTHSGIADCANMAFEMTKVRLKVGTAS